MKVEEGGRQGRGREAAGELINAHILARYQQCRHKKIPSVIVRSRRKEAKVEELKKKLTNVQL